MISARRRIECALPARLMLAVVNQGGFRAYDAEGNLVDRGEEETVTTLRQLLTDAAREPLDGLTLRERAKLARRIEREVSDATEPFVDQPSAKLALAVLYMVQRLTDDGVMELIDGSSFSRAADRFIEVLEEALQVERLDASARKASRRLLEALRARGYYRRTE